MAPLFTLTAVRKTYGNKITLAFEKLTVQRGRLYVLMRPNGSGKSTLLNILAFLMKPDSGEVEFDGCQVSWKSEELSLLRKRVTLMSQSPFLFSGSVFYNIAFGLKVRGVGGRELHKRVAELLAMVDLSGFEDRDTRQLSGGEARRVALARALAANPEVLLLDEPLANVDTRVASMLESLIAAQTKQGLTIIMSSHEAQQAERLASDVIQLADGTVDPERGADEGVLCKDVRIQQWSKSPAE